MTISDRAELFDTVEQIRSRGYSVNDQGYIEGLRSVGAPIVGPDDAAIGGLSIAGPIDRIKGERAEKRLYLLRRLPYTMGVNTRRRPLPEQPRQKATAVPVWLGSVATGAGTLAPSSPGR